MPRPITDDAALAVKRLLVNGISQRAVSRKLGVSRSTVGKIANGTYKLRHHTHDGMPEPDLRKKPRRCQKCGRRVYPPGCFPCWVESRA